jgi:peroxiredoxin
MAQLESRRQEIDAAGAQLAYVAAQKRDGAWKPAKFLKKHPVSFPFLLDEDRVLTKEYGLHHALGVDALNIAHPGTLVIDPSGIVRWIYRGDNQFDRAPLDEVLTAVRGIGK